MYTFTNTEITNKKATEFETKSLLYLIGMRKDSDEIDLLAVDCFNDVTGLNPDFSKLWDVQSKNHKSLPPSKIGDSLFTLYDNFISSIDFCEYVLFVPKLKRDYLVDCSQNNYLFSNIVPKTQKLITKALIKKIKKTYKSDDAPFLKEFLSKVLIVEDNKKISTYIKQLVKFKNKRIVDEDFYVEIFNELRNIQSGLKNSYIEGEKINTAAEVLKFNRHISKNDIQTFLINRFVGTDVFSFPGIPVDFLPVVSNLGGDKEEVEDLLQECNANLSRAFFDKAASRPFWHTIEEILTLVSKYPSNDVFYIFEHLSKKIKDRAIYLTDETVIYLISLIKTGLKNDS